MAGPPLNKGHRGGTGSPVSQHPRLSCAVTLRNTSAVPGVWGPGAGQGPRRGPVPTPEPQPRARWLERTGAAQPSAAALHGSARISLQLRKGILKLSDRKKDKKG